MSGRRLVIVRRAVQTLFVGGLVVILWNTRFPLQGFVNPAWYFHLDPLAMLLTALAERVLLPGLGLAIAMLALAAVLGRAFCGWLCPLGATIDLWTALTDPLRRVVRRARRHERGPGRWRYVKYAILAIMTAAALAGLQLAWTLDPLTVFVRAFSFTVHPAVNAALDSTLAALITASGYAAPLEAFYRLLQGPVLSLALPAFPHTGVITGLFAAILLMALVRRRLWCRVLCPLGALLALPARRPLLQRRTDCTVNCGTCRHVCRMGAIRTDNSYAPEECVLCMDCLADCPHDTAVFTIRRPKPRPANPAPASAPQQRITRHAFVRATLSSAAALALPASLSAQYPPDTTAGDTAPPAAAEPPAPLVRPPGALTETEFVQRCIRCGNCMKVCPTNVLQPAGGHYGLAGLWTPRLEPAIGYCEYNCTLCGQVCPTEAIAPLPLKNKKAWVMGIAVIDRKTCLPWAKGTPCIVCEEHCPVGDKAIKLDDVTVQGRRLRRPRIDETLCIGCAICVNKCPVRPVRAIRVDPPKRRGSRAT